MNNNAFSIAFLFLLLLAHPAVCNQPSGDKPPAATGWQQLGLSSTVVDGVTVYYEKSLEPNVPIFETELKTLLAERGRPTSILVKSDDIIRDINRILGVTDPDTQCQSKILAGLMSGFLRAKPTLYLVTRPSVKSFLRAGGKLPDCTYDKTTDMVSYTPHFHFTVASGPLKEFELALPISPDKDFAGQVGGIFEWLKRAVSGLQNGLRHS